MEQRDFESWPQVRHRRPRLLIEDPDPALLVSDFRRFTEAGFDVALCSGPDQTEECPLVGRGECSMAAAADVIVMGTGLGESRDVISAALHRHHPRVPVIARVARQSLEDVPDGCIPLPTPMSVDGQVRVVWRAVERPVVSISAPEPAVPSQAPFCSSAASATEARLMDLLGW
jgi:hypothetical protein